MVSMLRNKWIAQNAFCNESKIHEVVLYKFRAIKSFHLLHRVQYFTTPDKITRITHPPGICSPGISGIWKSKILK